MKRMHSIYETKNRLDDNLFEVQKSSRFAAMGQQITKKYFLLKRKRIF